MLVSEVGAFAELPDDVCLKVPVGPDEEDLIFEYLNLLVSRRDARQIAGRAGAGIRGARECNWETVAQRYASFLCAVKDGRDWQRAGNHRRSRARIRSLSSGIHRRLGGRRQAAQEYI